MKQGAKMEILMESGGRILMELWPDVAPRACAGIEKIINLKKYDGKVIERLEPGFVIQPLFQDGLDEDIDELIEPEFLTNPGQKELRFDRGIVGMAGIKDKASASQFYITLAPVERLNGHFTIVGKVIDGWDEVQRLEGVEVEEKVDEPSGFHYHKPVKDEVVKQVRLLEIS
ncbi:MAG: peptidylprolyl isomerase [Lachnospiraceae bacterium]|nr:peptidylprolyl isomerase [Lachnospiraceae bacterium]